MSRIDLLILSSLARIPMHGYELKLELKYKHVRWWAKCDHGHLYAALKRLERQKHIRGKTRRDGERARRVFTITATGKRHLAHALRDLIEAPDTTYFDVDLFLAASFTLDKRVALSMLRARAERLEEQRLEAESLVARMGANVPRAAALIMRHRVEHLAREVEFALGAADSLASEPRWGPFLGEESISDFIERTAVQLEP